MRTRAYGVLVAAAAIALAMLQFTAPAAAAQAAGTVLYTLQPIGFRGQLVVIGSAVGKVLHTADGGQVFGFDLDQIGNDGLLASAQTVSPQDQVLASVHH